MARSRVSPAAGLLWSRTNGSATRTTSPTSMSLQLGSRSRRRRSGGPAKRSRSASKVFLMLVNVCRELCRPRNFSVCGLAAPWVLMLSASTRLLMRTNLPSNPGCSYQLHWMPKILRTAARSYCRSPALTTCCSVRVVTVEALASTPVMRRKPIWPAALTGINAPSSRQISVSMNCLPSAFSSPAKRRMRPLLWSAGLYQSRPTFRNSSATTSAGSIPRCQLLGSGVAVPGTSPVSSA